MQLNLLGRRYFPLVLALSFMAAGLVARGETSPEGSPTDGETPVPGLTFTRKMRGESAIEALGQQLPKIAAFYRISESSLKELLRRDRSLWVDEKGRLLYVCEWKPDEASVSNQEPAVFAAPFPEEDTFRLHSRPGANRIIFLDFDGCNASSTSWGADSIGRAFDTDSNASSFSSSERTIIQGVWQRVAEDYAMYDVDVTTEDPGTEALRKSSSSDTVYGIRVAIGGSSSDWYGSGAGGVAYVGSFNWSSDTPCWVFPASLGNSEKNIAEAASHEAGHTLGLSHDGQDVGSTHTEYYSGQGNWAPIMGVGYSKPITQWSKGEYANADNKEDDLTKMLSYGVAYRSDDHGSSMAAATAVHGVSFSIPGNVERATDIDYFRVQTGAGLVTLTAQPAAKGGNLHIQLTLLNASGSVLATANPVDTSAGVPAATLSTTLAAGTYYVVVEGVSSGDPTTTGYSDYGSLGAYTLIGALPSTGSWIASAPGSDYSWTTPVNWSGGSFPFGDGAVVRFNNNIAGDQTIGVDSPQIIGGLLIGDADSQNSFRLQNGVGGRITFRSSPGEAWLSKLSGTNDTVAATLVLDSNLSVTNTSAADLTLSGTIFGTGAFTKAGTGRVMYEGTNSCTGSLVAREGTFALGVTALISNPNVDVRSTAQLDVRDCLGGWVCTAGQNLTGEGIVLGDCAVANGAAVSPGSNNVPGVLTIQGTVQFAAGARLDFDLGSDTSAASGSNDLLVVRGDLDLAGPVVVEFSFPESLPVSPGTYTLINYTGAFSGGVANLQAANAGNRYVYEFDDSVPGEIRVVVSGNPAPLAWRGDGSVNLWDIGISTNWVVADNPAQFQQLDRVLFDDAGSNSPSISLTAGVEPGAVEFPGANDYSLIGSGKIVGKASVGKSGRGTLLLATANSYAGQTTVSGGRLKLGNASALGAAGGETIVTNGATLDFNGFDIGAEHLMISGSGISGIGALYNLSTGPRTNAARFVRLAADATIGGIGRWDVRANPTGSFEGNHFGLTKTGVNDIWLANVGPSGLGNISIVQGTLGFEGSTTLGDSSATLTVLTNATLGLAKNKDNTLSKALVLSGGKINCLDGFNTFVGPVTLIGNNTVQVGSVLAIRGTISGAGMLDKTGSGTLMLTAGNAYTGETRVSAGALEVYNGLALGSVAVGTTIASGARLDVRGINLGAEPINVQGTGLGNAGAIVNTGSAQNNALRFVTLSGATTFGGINRWDIRANPTGSLTGNNYALTKRGPNEIWLVDLGATGLGSITVAEGLLGFQGTTTLGGPTTSMTVNSGASVGIYSTGTNILSKTLSLSSGRIYNASGSNTFAGSVTMTGSNRLDIASGTKLVMSGNLSGSGALYKLGGGTLVVAGNDTISGLTHVSAGTLQVGVGGGTGALGSGAVSNSGSILFFRNNALSVPGPISGSGTLQVGMLDTSNPYVGGTVILAGGNTYSGNTIVYGNGNFVGLGNDNCIGTGTLLLNGNNNGTSVSGVRAGSTVARTLTNTVQLGSGGSFQFGAPGTGDLVFSGGRILTDSADKLLIISNTLTTINSDIGGSSRLIKSGPGTLVLGGNNTNGAMVIEMGTVRVDSESRLGRNPGVFSPGQLTLNGGTLQATSTFAIDDSNRGVTLSENGGTLNVNPGCSLGMSQSITGPGALRKLGSGTVQLSGINTYTGGTTNLDGTLILNGEVTGQTLEIAAGALRGFGRCFAPVVVRPAGTLDPGLPLGTLTISNTLQLAGTTVMEIDAALNSCDLVEGMSTVTYGGTLQVQNVQGALAKDAIFKLFGAAVYQGSFQTVALPELPSGLFWDLTKLNVDGTIQVAEQKAMFASANVEDGSIVLAGSGGQPGSEFVIRTSADASAPLPSWTIIGTNTFDATGSFSLTNAIDPAVQQLFYLIQTSGW